MKKINLIFSIGNLIPIILVLFLFITTTTLMSQEVVHPTSVTTGVFLGETPPLRDLPVITDWDQFNKDMATKKGVIKQRNKAENNPGIRDKNYSDADNALLGKDDEVWQKEQKSIQAAPLVIQNFAGANGSGSIPTDCNGAVGPNHYMQTINTTYSIYNKTGTKLAGPTAMNSIFSGVTGATFNDGDPIIIYDDFADRWLAAEFSVSGANDYMLVAVSTTNDPTGTWYKYSFDVDDMPDYMKFGVWSDGYYMGTNNGSSKDVYVFQRSVMITGGASPTMIGFDNPNRPNSGFHCIQPLDADFYATPGGAPGMFVTINDGAWGGTDQVWLYELSANWTTPASSTFSRISTLATSAFDGNFGAGTTNISQPGTTQKLDGISQVLMYRAQYINFGSYQTIVCCHSVDVNGADKAGIRWYELRKSGGVWSIRQQGTYSPDAGHRWLGSISMNKNHEIGLAYSYTNPTTTVYPGLKFTGQSATENGLASGVFDITETNIVTGLSSQTTDRWGDYAQMSVDPVDQRTFWFTSQYMKAGGSSLGTQIISFNYPVTSDPPATDFYATTPTLYEGETTNFTDITTSVGAITAWSWAFEGAVPTSSTVQNPTNITYNQQGTYKVRLTATNANGSTTLEKVEYITVLGGVRPTQIWCDNFSTPANWVTQIISGGDVNGGGNDNWIITSGTPTTGGAGKINSTSGGNYAMYNSDSMSTVEGGQQWAHLTTVNGINCSSYGVVYLKFQQNYRRYVDSTMVYISTDNFVTSKRYEFNSDVAYYGGITSNPDNKTIDISAIAGGKTNVKIRFTFRSTANTMGASAGWAWVWQVDDVCLEGAPQGTTMPTANFSATPREIQTGQSVNYTDLSAGATTWLWSFEGGTPSSSTLQNPTNIVYNTTGWFQTSLTAGNNNGTVTETKTDFVHVFYDCAFDESNNQDGDVLSYNYYDDPAITTEWGYIPGHNSASITTYADKITVVGAPGKVKSLAVGVGTADVVGGAGNVTFRVWTDNAGVPGTLITSKVVPVSELLAGSINYIDFTPVSVTSTFFVGFEIAYAANLDTFACYISKGGNGRTNTAYVLDGTWQTYESRFGMNASLYIFPEYCIDKPATNKPDVDFYADKTAIAVGGTVNFFDQSTGGAVPTAWTWTLPGVTPTTSSLQNPASKTYGTAGIYDVTLQATNANGANSKTKGGYIHVANTSNIVYWNFPNNPDNATADGGIALNTSQQISNWVLTQTMTFATAGATTRAARVNAWDDANANPSTAWSTTFTTVGYTNIKLSSKQASTAGGPQNFSVYYSVNGGDFQFLATVPPITTASTWTQGVLNNIQMPADCDNQNAIEVVWYKTTDVSISGGAINATTGYSLIDDIYITGQICNTMPSAAGTITGTATVCQGQTGVAYSVPTITNATYYEWVLPTGATFASGQYTSSITVDFAINQAAGNISVYGVNMCGSGTASANYPVAVNNVPTQPGNITGSQTATNGQTNINYSITAVGGATSYTWTVPSFATIASGGTTVNPKLNFACPGEIGFISVHANNACGASQESYAMPITITCSPDADFFASTTKPCVGGSVTFTDASTNDPTTWSWSFTGGTPATSSLQFPTVTYSTAGTYNVVLTATNATGSNIETKTGYIVCGNPSLSTSTTSVSAPGACDGSATAIPSGNAPYTYTWSTISSTFAGNTGTITNSVFNQNFTNTVSGLGNLDGISYLLNKVCVNITANRMADIDIFLLDPTGYITTLTADLGGTVVGSYNVCFTRTATNDITLANFPNATGDYNPILTNTIDGYNTGSSANGTWTLRINDDAAQQGTPNTNTLNSWTLYFDVNKTSASATGLCEGSYNLTITDANGCTANSSANVTFASPLAASITAQTNVACFGGSTGSATVTATGGTTPYTYAWSGGGTSATKSSLVAGTYTVTVTDANTNTATASVTITQPASALSASITAQTNVACFGNSTGSATVTASGGTTAYSYLWTGGGTSVTKSSLAAGTYTVTVTDANSCTTTASATITQPASALSASITAQTNVACFSNSTGSATVTASGGTTAYSYNWAGTPTGDGTATITGLVAGNYAVTITDANSCTATTTATITQPASALSVSISKTNVACFGNSTGSATATPAGGTTGYTYLWTGGATTASISSMPAGTYTITVTDANSCTATATTTITQPAAALSASISAQTNVACFGNSTGSATVTVSGGTTAYSYLWTGGGTTATKSSLVAGTYTVTVTDANSCTTTATAIITQPASALTATISAQTNVSCNGGSTGTATVTAGGGTAGYSYLWNDPVPAQTTATATALTAGTWTVTVTDGNSCTQTANVTITQPTVLTATISAQTNVSCNGGSTGTATVTAGGGTAGYSYLWNDPAPAQTTATATALTAGTWTVTVTDGNSCTQTANVTISEPASALSATITAQTNVLCFGNSTGSATVTANGGTTTYSYLWQGGGTSSTKSSLAAGTYTVTVTDANSCTTTASATITQPASGLSVSISTVNVACFGASTGSATATVSGGTGSPTYAWTGGATTASITNMPSGVYTVTVTDASTCTATATTTISQPASALVANILGTNVSCFGGSDGLANLVATGGTTTYTYNWSNSATTEDLTGLAIGTYTVTVTDANSCTANASVTISQPAAALLATIVGTDLTCNGSANGSANLTVSGGTVAYSYLWSNGASTQDLSGLSAGNYSVTVTDSEGCQTTASVTITEPVAISLAMSKTDATCSGFSNGTATVTASGGTSPFNYLWTGGSTTQSIVGKPAGTYFVTVTDANSCTAISSIVITQPSALTASISAQTNVLCNGGTNGSATVTATGGIAGYTYLWTGGVTSATTSSLSAGTYTVTVTDANNCTSIANATITQPSLALSASTTQTNVNCFGASTGSATVIANGGTPGFSYLWTGGGTSATKNGLIAGTYTVTVTDNNSCTTTASVTITEPTVLSASTSKTDVSCNALCDGTATANVSGGTLPYSYSWSNLQSTQTATNLCAATYNLTVTDLNNCTSTSNAVITEPLAIVITSSVSNASCGNSDGSASVSVSGGQTPYTYLWSTGATVSNISAVASGSYGVTVTDANGCSNTASADINDSGAPSATASNTNVTCNGACDGTALVSATGGTSPYSYSWSNTATTASVSSLCNATYSVTVTDQIGCKATASVTVTQPTVLNASITSFSNVVCNSEANGSATISVSGGSSPYSYIWSNSASIATASGLIVGVYSVTVLDNNSCSKIASVTISEPTAISITSSSTDVLCNGGTTGTASIVASGGTPSYSYNWATGGSTASESNLAVGSYTVTVTDANSCTNTTTVTINEPTALSASATSSNITCNGSNDGSIDLTVAGGTTSYTYLWSSSATTEDISGLSANNYSVTITDANGCQTNASANITEPSALSATYTVTNVNCNGNATGAVNVTVTGGTTAYSYLWDNSATSEDLSGVTAGTYNLTVTDANGCQTVVNAVVAEPSVLALTPSSTDATCGASNGAASVSVSGGSLPYTYLWSNGATSNSLSNVSAGSYDVTVTDGNSCIASASIIINNAGAPTISVVSVSNVSCFGNADGDALINVSGGVTPYIYSWSNGAASASISGLIADSYTVTVTDAMGCTSLANLTVTEPLELTATVVGTDVSCNGTSTGSANLSVTGGTTTYSYNWTGGISTEDLNGVIAGTYDVTVNDANGCSANASVVISEPFALSLTYAVTDENLGNDGAINLTVAGGMAGYTFNWSNSASTEDLSGLNGGTYNVTVTDANGCTANANIVVNGIVCGLTASIAGTDLTCNSGSNGSADLTVLGGTGSYTYIWSNGATTEDLSGIAAGNYDVTATDVNSCTVSTSIVITEPSAISLSYIVTDENLGNDGAIDLTVSGGTVGYTFNWSSGSTTEDLSALVGGTYNVTVTDANGCTNTVSAIVNGMGCNISASATSTNVTCNGGIDGTANLTVTGGTSPFTFNWSNGAITEDLSGINAGSYNVTITDVNSCSATASAVIAEPSAISLSYIVTDENLGNDGAIDLTVSGGTVGYTFNWSSGSTTEDLSALVGGTYNVTVTDANGCTNTVSAIVNGMGCNLSASATSTNVACNGGTDGTANLTVTGGTSPFTFNWSNGAITEDLSGINAGSYNVTITDVNSCSATASAVITEPSAISLSYIVTDENLGNDGAIDLTVSGGIAGYTFNWSNGNTAEDLSALVGGTYNVTVTDANGCTNTASAIVNGMGCNISASATSTNITCNGGTDGTANLTVTGGTSPFTYLWSNGGTSASLSNLTAGSYDVTVTDANSCSATASVVITEPSVLSAVASSTNSNCGSSDGTATVSVSGGVNPYSYLWSNGATTASLTGLTGGTYSVTVSDVNNCTAYANTTIGYVGGPSLNFTTSDVTCNGLCNGMSSVSASGGTAPYTYLWSNGNAGMFALNICAGTYTVTATDATGCTGTSSVTINEPLAVSVSISSTNASCGNADGSATANATGGTAPYGYTWNTTATTQTINNLLAGNYLVTITDFKGCKGYGSVNITNSNAPVVNSVTSNPTCFGQCTGIASVSSTGGTAPYTYSWWDGHSGQFAMNLCNGNYSVTSTDNSGCATTYIVSITTPSEIILVMDSVNATTSTSTDGSASVTASGGTAAYTYSWNNGGTTPTISGLLWGTYTVTVTDANGCTKVSSIEVSFTDAIAATIEGNVYINVYPNPSNGEFEVLVSSKNNSMVTYKVYNTEGQIIYMKSLNKTTNIQNSKIDIRNNARGIYNLEIRTEQGVHQKRLIIK